MPSPFYILTLLLAIGFTLATRIHVWMLEWEGARTSATGVLEVMMGDSRAVFGDYFFNKADVYFHAGYYPSIFDRVSKTEKTHLEAKATQNHDKAEQQAEETDLDDYLKEPRTWIDAFGRHFYPSRHVHLEKPGEEREILPWLRMSASLDPHRIQTYTVAAYWLRTRLGKKAEAEQFLREGWQANPDSYEILFELGRLYEEDHNDPVRARNLMEQAWKRYLASIQNSPPEELLFPGSVLTHLARLEERLGNIPKAIEYLKLWLALTPSKEHIQKQIDELTQRLPKS